MGAYETVLPVRFGQVDYAGIMFYPRFFENFHAVFEDMFGARLGVPYMSILKERRLGFPTVAIETTFRRPFRFGDPMRLVIDVVAIGRTSTTFRYRGYNGDEREPSVEALTSAPESGDEASDITTDSWPRNRPIASSDSASHSATT